ncbi:MAG TPA: putative ABC exporter domain-containing protein [Candidatus Eremiobacteraceae bacterium]|nr:putative ABC exporter domain-containing protein [Candidatus Eremiobacteraceae bacterium]
MRDLAPLFYLEARMAVQKFKRVLHQPARLTLWIIFIVWFGTFLVMRMQRLTGTEYAVLIPDSTHLFYAFVPAAYIVILGIQIRAGARRPPAAFSYPADARFLFGSHMSHVVVVFWLQLREAAFQGMRVFLALFFLSWNLAASASGFFFAVVTLLSAYVVAFGLRLPVFLAQRRMPRIPFAWFGSALVAGGTLAVLYPIALAFSSNNLHLAFIAAHTPIFPPGTLIVEALTGSTSAALVLVVAACSCIAAGSVAAADAYPEIWEASSRLYARRALAASGRGMWNRSAWRELQDVDHSKPRLVLRETPSASGEHAPTGALTVLWREWIALRRSAGGLRWPLFWIAGAAIFGYLGGMAVSGRSIFDILVPLVAIVNIVVIIGSQSTISLGNELRRPIWWLGNSTLRNRVVAWILGTTLRIGPPLVAGAIMAGLALHSSAVAAGAGPVVVVGLFLVQTIGVASYVALPGRNDMRGPGFMLRILTTYTALGLPALAWAMVQAISQNAFAGLGVGLGVALAEAWMLLSFSAARLEENAMAYAAAEEH